MNKSLLLFPATASVVPLLVLGGSVGGANVGSIVSRIISENLFKGIMVSPLIGETVSGL